MTRREIIEITLLCEILQHCSIEPELCTFDDIPCDEKHRDLVTTVCTSMYDFVKCPSNIDRETTIDNLIQYVFDNIACHHRDDDLDFIDALCNLITPMK